MANKGAIPFAYERTTPDLGFVTFESQKLVSLDGQHRAKAFQMVMRWIEYKESRPKYLQLDEGLRDDLVTIILVEFDKSLSRYIFNKINKYAKPTSKAGKLITDDDDSMAVISRSLVENGPIPRRLVNTESNSLNKTAHEFTLFSTFHDANRALLSALPIQTIVKPEKMDALERDRRKVEIAEEWQRLISGIRKWGETLQDPRETGDEGRRAFREKSLLGRPIGQLAIVKGYAYACGQMGQAADKNILVKKTEQDKLEHKQ